MSTKFEVNGWYNKLSLFQTFQEYRLVLCKLGFFYIKIIFVKGFLKFSLVFIRKYQKYQKKSKFLTINFV